MNKVTLERILSKKKLRIGIIGAGSIGSLFGGYLANINTDDYSTEVIFFCREAHAKALKQNGLIIQKNKEFIEVKGIKAFVDLKEYENILGEASSIGFDFLFLATKAYDTERVVPQYKKLIEKSVWLIILQNGIGNEEVVVKYCSKPKSDIIRIVTSNGALLKEPGRLIHTGEGITKIGFPYLEEVSLETKEYEKARKDLKLLGDLLNSVKLETLIIEDIVKECWEKVFVNIGINAIGALTRLHNGKLLEFEGLNYIMRESINEAILIAKMRNLNLPEKDYYAIAYDVAKKTAKNKNSMLQDILNHKATEIEFINGKIVKFAEQLDVDVPINRILTYLIKGLESSTI